MKLFNWKKKKEQRKMSIEKIKAALEKVETNSKTGTGHGQLIVNQADFDALKKSVAEAAEPSETQPPPPK